MTIKIGCTEARTVLAGDVEPDDAADLALIMLATVEHRRLVLEAEQRYLIWRPWLILMRKFGRLPEPYPPARTWALKRVGKLSDVMSRAAHPGYERG